MRRRSLVLLVSAITLGVLGILAVAAILFVMRTDVGREKLRAAIEPLIARGIPGGKVYLGKISGNPLTEITVDSFAIRDQSGELFVSTGRLTFSIDPRDIAEQRIVIRRARVEHPFVHLVQHEDETWNFKRIFASKDQGPAKPKDAARRGWGHYFVIDSTSARNGTFLLTMPWHPDTALKGAARDSSIRVHLKNPMKAVSRRPDGYGRTYSWTNASALLRHARLADPDSNHLGRRFVIDKLSADEFEPTFLFRNVSGEVKHLGDTLWLDIPHFDMPASTGKAAGRVWWGSDLPVRYDIAVRGDSVSLNDVNWVYPDLPRTGGGTLDLLIKNDPKNLKVIDFHLRQMDVRSEKSHLTGNMSFGTGAPVLLVRNVDVKADPVDFDLLRTLAGKPFPYDWQGQLFGTVKGRGGPLTNFVIDDARAEFRDAHVKGAVSRFTGRGELDILLPAFTAFHGFHVDAQSVDLRTIEFLNPNFPRLGGTISGTATLDSSWLDVRFSDADLTHQDGPGEPSHFTGSGRIITDSIMTYDVALDAQTLSLTMLSRSYPTMPFRGVLSGPIRAKGQATDLEVKTSLQGNAGALSFDGRLDVDSIGGYGAHGQGNFSSLNVGGLLENPKLSKGLLSGRYDVDLSGETAALLRGHMELDLAGTVIDSVRTYPTRARLAFGDGRVRIVDSLRLQTGAATLVARGAFGLPKGAPDSVRVSLTVDSLGGLRRYLSRGDNIVLATGEASVDSLSGSGEFTGVARGTMDSFSVTGRLIANDIYVNKDRGDSLSARVDVRGLPSAPVGIVAGRVSSVTLFGVALDTIGVRLDIADSEHARFVANALSSNGPRAATTGRWEKSGTDNLVFVDSLGLTIADSRWRLQAPTRVALDSSGGVRIDSLVLRNRDSAFVAVIADVPTVGAAFARLRMSRIPLADIGFLAQLRDSVSGLGDAMVSVTGTKMNPQITARADLNSVQWRKVGVERVNVSGAYRSGRFDAQADVIRGGKTALTAKANLPADVTLFSVRQRNDSINASLIADNADLEIVKGLSLVLAESKVSGRLNANVRVGGTMRAPVVDGTVSIADGQAFVPQLGATISGINGSVVGTRKAGGQDSLWVTLTASTEGKPTGAARLEGFVKNLLQTRSQQSFDLKLDANAFHAFNRRSLADLYLTTTSPIRLQGTTQSPTLNGAILIDRGSIYLADRDLARKQALDVFADSTTTTETAGSAMFATLMTNLRVPDLTVTLGEDVRLRSAEANVRLAGRLRVLTSTTRALRTVASSGNLIPTFDVEGELTTVGGSYNLNLGLVQREFSVLSDGTVTFDGDPKNPLLDIRAQHNVRRPGDRDLGVIVNLHGRLLPFPFLDFSSTAEYAIAQSDLISYLLIGRPGFDYAANQQASQVLGAFIAPTLSAFAADRLRQTMGSWVDALQVSFGTSGGAATTNLTTGGLDLGQYLLGTQIGAERQFKNVFLAVNTGFCGFQSGQTFDPSKALGAKVEYRFDPRLNLKLAYDPPTAGRVCNQQSIIGLVPAPPQFSLSFSHRWRF
ncbi:MAG TPA: translocation/assembly module TamB domain-containing protein [Gemmatimonadaceae bacterium]